MSCNFVCQLLKSVTTLLSALSQQQTNGASVLGTLQAPLIANFLTNNPLPNGFPWGLLTASNANPYTQYPNTGVIRSYDFTIARATIAPDGYQRSALVINGQYPGPLIEANWGDIIQVTVHNQISNPEEGTTLHYHGFLQKASEWQDGVPAVSQCPIAPGSSYTYTFQAQLYGTTWYHSHYSAQYASGLWGPLIVHGPKNVPYDLDLGPVTLNDYYHRDYYSIVKDVVGTNPALARPASDNNLINGKMDFDCSTVTDGTPCTNDAGISTFKFSSNKKMRLRLISSSAAAIQKFSIDGHTFTVMANDMVPVQPYNTTVVTLGVGQRTDVIVNGLSNSTGAYWMRSTIAVSGCTDPANQPYAIATVYYENANTKALPTSIAQPDNTDPCNNDPLSETTAYYPISPGNPSTTQQITVNVGINATGSVVWTMNGISYRGNYNHPLLEQAAANNLTFDPEWNVINTGSNNSVRVVMINNSPAAHPIHFHGHNFFVLAVGTGTWDGTVTNGNNPNRRDVQIMPPNGYLVMQWNQDNPGVWPLHCHIAWHVSAGFQVNILEQPSTVRALLLPSTLNNLCTDWNAYTASQAPDQIDSGLRME